MVAIHKGANPIKYKNKLNNQMLRAKNNININIYSFRLANPIKDAMESHDALLCRVELENSSSNFSSLLKELKIIWSYMS